MNKLLIEIAQNYPGYGKNGWSIQYHKSRNNLMFNRKEIFYWPKEYDMSFNKIKPVIEEYLNAK